MARKNQIIEGYKKRESAEKRVAKANRIIEKMNVPKEFHRYLQQELVACTTTESMRDRATALQEALIKPMLENSGRGSVVGLVSGRRTRESYGSAGLIDLTEAR